MPLSRDLILSDFHMPGCNGATLARMAQKTHPGIPLLILTAFRDDEMEVSLLKLGVKKILAKPIKEDALVQTIRDVLGPPEFAEELLKHPNIGPCR